MCRINRKQPNEGCGRTDVLMSVQRERFGFLLRQNKRQKKEKKKQKPQIILMMKKTSTEKNIVCHPHPPCDILLCSKPNVHVVRFSCVVCVYLLTTEHTTSLESPSTVKTKVYSRCVLQPRLSLCWIIHHLHIETELQSFLLNLIFPTFNGGDKISE